MGHNANTNYIVTPVQTTQTVGDSVAGGDIATTAALLITPTTGYILAASGFNISGGTASSGTTFTNGSGGVTLPSYVDKVVFADIGTANTTANTVTATVHFKTGAGVDLEMPSADKQVNIDIDIAVVQSTLRSICIKDYVFTATGHTITHTEGALITGSVLGSGPPKITQHTSSTLPEGLVSIIFSVTFAADAGFYYTSMPSYSLGFGSGNYNYNPYYTIVTSNITYDSNTNINGCTFEVSYNPPVNVLFIDPDPNPSGTSQCELGHNIYFNTELAETEGERGVVADEITSIATGIGNIPNIGGFRNLRVHGTVGAKYDLTITKEGSTTYNFTTNAFTAGATDTGTQTIPAAGYIDHGIVYPLITATSTYYDIEIDKVGTTTLNATIPTQVSPSNPYLRIYQYKNLSITVTPTSTEHTSPTYTSLPTITLYPNSPPSGGSTETPIAFTLTPGMLPEGFTTYTLKDNPTFVFTGTPLSTAVTEPSSSSTSLVIANTSTLIAGMDISWSEDKTLGDGVSASRTITLPNTTNLTTGMAISGTGITANLTIVTIPTSTTIIVSIEQTLTGGTVLTFTAQNITIASITNATTLVASKSLTLNTSVQLIFSTNTNFSFNDFSAVKNGENVEITGKLYLSSMGTSSFTTNLEIDNIVTES